MCNPRCILLQQALLLVSSLVCSTNGGLASVIDNALGMLLGCETSGTAAHLCVVP